MVEEVIREEVLQAYVDGQIPPDRRETVEAFLATDPETARRLAAYQTQNDLLHTLYDPVLDEPRPDRLALPTAVSPVSWARRTAAALAFLLLGAAAGWWLKDLHEDRARSSGRQFAERAATAYAVFTPEVRHPVEVTADAEAHLLKWLSKRLRADLEAPSLAATGFALVGGRLLSDPDGSAALFMYENEQGHRLTLYVKRRDHRVAETAFRYVHQDGVGVFYWIDTELSYALAGELEKAALLAVTHVVYDQIED